MERLFQIIQSEIQFERVHTSFAEYTQTWCVGVEAHEFENFFDREIPNLGDSWRLELRVVHADVRIQSAARSGDSISRYGVVRS